MLVFSPQRLGRCPLATRKEQIAYARKRGHEAFHNGKPHGAPALDGEIMNMLKDRQVGQTPEGEASTIEILTAYSEAYQGEALKSVGLTPSPSTLAA
jgi:hypothetical protein